MNMRTIRERAVPMVQETSISGQVSKILEEKSTELLRISTIPANLWPEAFKHVVWLKTALRVAPSERRTKRLLGKRSMDNVFGGVEPTLPTLLRSERPQK